MKLKYDIYISNPSNSNRYALGRSGANTLIVFGVNPSVATNMKSDNTLTKIDKFSKLHGFDSFVVFNVYPKRSTDPNKLPKRALQSSHKENLSVINEFLEGIKKPVIWAAWGTTILKRNYLIKCLNEINTLTEKFNPSWMICGEKTKTGHPRHPSRLGYKNTFFEFNIDEYLNTLK